MARSRVSRVFAVIGRSVLAISGIYALSLTVFLVLRAAIGERLPVIALINLFLHLLLMPAFILLPLSILYRRWWITLNLAIACVVFLSSYGVFFTPRSMAAVPSAATLKILTYNLHAEAKDLDGMIAVIRASGADIVALQEVSAAATSRFSKDLAQLYPYQALHPQRYANAGQGVLSRYPLVADQYWRNSRPPDSLGHQRVEVDLSGTTITVYNFHTLRPVMRGLSFDDQSRRIDVTDLLDRTEKDSGPILAVGDFNMTDQTEDYHRITAQFSDTYREVGSGMGFTFPDADPVTPTTQKIRRLIQFPLLLRLDYVFHNDAFQPVEAVVWPDSGGSDHHPLFVRLALRT
jgi:vancomycin resistance protein VanJ